MSVSIDDIWSLPISQPGELIQDDVEVSSRPTKRRRSTLFLEGSDEESSSELPAAVNASPKVADRPDIDHLFEDIEEPEVTEDAPKAFDLDAYRREAGKRAADAAPQATQSSSPARENNANASVRKRRKDDDDDEPKERKPLPKLDHSRLLGKDGLPALVAQSKTFKPKGKGHEV